MAAASNSSATIYFADDKNWHTANDGIWIWNWSSNADGARSKMNEDPELSAAYGGEYTIYSVTLNLTSKPNFLFINASSGWTRDNTGIIQSSDIKNVSLGTNTNLCYYASDTEHPVALATTLANKTLYFSKSVFEGATITVANGEQDQSLNTVGDDDTILSYTFPSDSTANWNTAITVTRDGESETFYWTDWTKNFVKTFGNSPTMSSYSVVKPNIYLVDNDSKLSNGAWAWCWGAAGSKGMVMSYEPELTQAYGGANKIYSLTLDYSDYNNLIFYSVDVTGGAGNDGKLSGDISDLKSKMGSNANLCFYTKDVNTATTLATTLAGKTLYFTKSEFEGATINVGGNEVELSTVTDDDSVLSYTFPADSKANWDTQITVTKETGEITETAVLTWIDWVNTDLVKTFGDEHPTEKYFIDAGYINNATDLKKLADSSADGKVYKLGASFSSSDVISISKNVALDLNGKTLTFNGSGRFEVNENGSLTIKDSGTGTVTETTSTPDVEKYGNIGSITGTISDVTLKYYVTESTVSSKSVSVTGTNANTYSVAGTTETVVLHEVNFKNCGAIIANGSAIQVMKGTANITGGILKGNGEHVIDIYTGQGGTVNLSGGLIWGRSSDSYSGNGAGIYVGEGTVNMSGGYIAGGKCACGGGIYINKGTVNISGGAVAVNESKAGGGVYMNDGTLNITGGAIASNQTSNEEAVNGGGIYANAGTINISGGYVTNNKKQNGTNDGNGKHGGGGVVLKAAKMYMSGGYITGNYSGEAGGGIYAGFHGDSGADVGCRFVMTGGTIASNYANISEGGGIRVSGGTIADIYSYSGARIYITNNETNTHNDWGGGGIFVQQHGTLRIQNALFAGNSAGGFGGGVAGCPSGDVTAVDDKGAVNFGNTASGTNMSGGTNGKSSDSYLKEGSDQDSSVFLANGYKDYFCVGKSTISGRMLGGYERWSGSIDGRVVNFTGGEQKNSSRSIGLVAHPTSTDVSSALKKATVIITGNTSYTHGGGIMSNGVLSLGMTDREEYSPELTIKATKQLTARGLSIGVTDKQFSFVLLSKKPTLKDGSFQYDEGDVVKRASNDASGNIVFDPITYLGTGTFTYYLAEEAVDDEEITQDTALYKVQVNVTSTSETKTISGVETTVVTYSISDIKVTGVTGADAAVQSTVVSQTNGSVTNKTVTITRIGSNATFTNEKEVGYELPETGGAGTALYTLGGLLLMAVAEFFLLYNYKKRRKEDVASS